MVTEQNIYKPLLHSDKMEKKTAKILLTVLIAVVAVALLVTVGYVIKNKYGKELPVFTLYGPEQIAPTNAGNVSKITFTFNTSGISNDNSLVVTDLKAKEVDKTWIYWTWTNPVSEDFGRCMLYLDGKNIKNTTKEYYNATDLNPGTNHTIKIYVMDKYGERQNDYASDTSTTLYGVDTAAPSKVDEIKVASRDATSIGWKWTNPPESDFDKAIVFINGVNVKNTTENHYKATGLNQNTVYTINIHTMDTNGNINAHDVTNSTRTCLNVCSFGHCNTYCA